MEEKEANKGHRLPLWATRAQSHWGASGSLCGVHVRAAPLRSKEGIFMILLAESCSRALTPQHCQSVLFED